MDRALLMRVKKKVKKQLLKAREKATQVMSSGTIAVQTINITKVIGNLENYPWNS